MKKDGILNADLLRALGLLGHTDQLVICDAGLPIPNGPQRIDLAFRLSVPTFSEVLSGILEEIVVEGAVAAEEVVEGNQDCHTVLSRLLPDLELLPHEELKSRVATAKLVVRTGEATPFANVILSCGVPF